MPVALLEAMRPYQWVKNLLVFAPLLFARKTGDSQAIVEACIAFAVFCLLASGIYLFNDVFDRQADRAHERKRHRPIAAGRLQVSTALTASLVLVVAAFALAFVLYRDRQTLPFPAWPGAYLALNIAYTLGLKRQVIVDGLCIAIGFVLRVHAGSVAIDVESSRWILLCTFFFAMFLAFCKRRDEAAKYGDGATRSTMRDYTLPFLDQIIAPLAALSILAYALYTLAPETQAKHGPNLMLTVPFVVFGVFRYLFLVHQREEGGDPSRLLFRDPPLMIGGALWLASVVAVLSAHGA